MPSLRSLKVTVASRSSVSHLLSSTFFGICAQPSIDGLSHVARVVRNPPSDYHRDFQNPTKTTPLSMSTHIRASEPMVKTYNFTANGYASQCLRVLLLHILSAQQISQLNDQLRVRQPVTYLRILPLQRSKSSPSNYSTY